MQKPIISDSAKAILLISKEGEGMSPADISYATHASYPLHTCQISARLGFTAHLVRDL